MPVPVQVHSCPRVVHLLPRARVDWPVQCALHRQNFVEPGGHIHHPRRQCSHCSVRRARGELVVMHTHADGLMTLAHFGITGAWALLSCLQILNATRLSVLGAVCSICRVNPIVHAPGTRAHRVAGAAVLCRCSRQRHAPLPGCHAPALGN